VSEGGYEVICNACRATVSSDARVCPQCGERPDAPAPTPVGGFVSPMRVATSYSGAGGGYELPTAFMSPQWPRDLRYAGFWIRVAAYLIDSLVIVTTITIAGYFLGAWVGLFWLATLLLYFPLMESGAGQGTIGKQALNLRVTDLQGQRVSFGRALGRSFAKVLSSLFLCIGYLMIAVTGRSQGLHDLIAKTLVVRG
jgi:uncharacterized RDD family membrane protein YckC